MSSIYVVTKGSYSDYHIVGIFDDEQAASKIAAHIGGKVETYTLNPDSDKYHQGLMPYRVEIDKEDCQVQTDAGYGGSDYSKEYAKHYIIGTFGGRAILCTEVWARDKQHAAKIANERRAFLVAEGVFNDAEKWYRPLEYWN